MSRGKAIYYGRATHTEREEDLIVFIDTGNDELKVGSEHLLENQVIVNDNGYTFTKEEREIYQHYKGGKYLYIGDAEDVQRKERLVLYMSLETHDLYARPSKMFWEKVEIEGVTRPRFRKVEDIKVV